MPNKNFIIRNGLVVGNTTTSYLTANSTKIVISNTVSIEANGASGNSGAILSSSGNTVYWAVPLRVYNVSNTQLYP